MAYPCILDVMQNALLVACNGTTIWAALNVLRLRHDLCIQHSCILLAWSKWCILLHLLIYYVLVRRSRPMAPQLQSTHSRSDIDCAALHGSRIKASAMMYFVMQCLLPQETYTRVA